MPSNTWCRGTWSVSGDRGNERLDKTERAVQERLTREFYYWDGRAAHLRAQEEAGKFHARLNSRRAQQRADDLRERLAQRKEQINQERLISATRPIVAGGALIIPIGLLQGDQIGPQVIDTRKSEAIAMRLVMAAERALGNTPQDVSSQRGIGRDIESTTGSDGQAPLHRGQGTAERRARCDPDQERAVYRFQQSGSVHIGAGRD